MESLKGRMTELTAEEKIDNLVAIGAAVGSNCIPCFEHLFEKAITSGITVAEIKRAAKIAERVKAGAQTALANSVSELVGDQKTRGFPCSQTADKSCCG
jgi:4-carboxymuconolactone decarboxylase